MTGVILRGLAARKARALLTAIAVVLGVAMISGTFVLMDTVMSGYSQIFSGAYVHTDAVVTAQAPFGAIGASKPALPASLLARIRALPQVLRAHGYIDAHAQLTTAAGAPVGKQSTEASVFGIPTGELDTMTPLRLVAGHWPSGTEVIIDQATANAGHLRIGETAGLVARKPLQRFRIVGIFRFGGATSLGPAQFAAVDLPVAQQIFDKPAMVDEIDVAARPGIPASALTAAIRRVLPGIAKVTTATAQAATATADVDAQFNLLRYALLACGAVALFTGSFIIFNTLSITVAQRTRELATLRTLGASRRQVLASILAEAGLVGAVASVAGLAAGVGFAKSLTALFASSGVRLPAAGTVIGWRTVAVSLGAGLGVTLAAGLVPALRAMRIPPLLAIRDGSGRPGRRSQRRGYPGQPAGDGPATAAGRRRSRAVRWRGRRLTLGRGSAGRRHRQADRAAHPRGRRTRP
jgi:putative ABC transport system permease protein